ncbi:MAG TPA: ABC transporter permease subunit [Firmicutes bacterium]|jgi:alpha-glucoside transport system permease protein|nr:ABC transporter permease subunit [Bacillota bacterium]
MPTPVTSSAAAHTGRRRDKMKNKLATIAFLGPAFIVLGLLVYAIVFTVGRSFFDAYGGFVGFRNYQRVFSEQRMLVAVRNNAIWVAIVPAVVTSLGVVFAVLTERIRWSAAFRMVLFMPLVISSLAAGVTFRFMYAGNPNEGFVNAVIQQVVHIAKPPGLYPGARLSTDDFAVAVDGAFESKAPVQLGGQANFALAAIRPQLVPENATTLTVPASSQSSISGVVWLDFLSGGRGTRGYPDPEKTGLPGIRVEAVKDGKVVATAYTGNDGSYALTGLAPGAYTIRLSADSFRQPFGGYYWLGRDFIIPALIIAYVWINTGFAVMMIGAGLSSINRDLLEAARTEGANEWQVFRYVTIPALMPVVTVIFVRGIISVLKIFDLVLVVAPEPVRADATVLALEMWNAAFGGMNDHGLGSALATILFLLILPVMLSNIRRFRLDQQ